jgi:hypothetical protein
LDLSCLCMTALMLSACNSVNVLESREDARRHETRL